MLLVASAEQTHFVSHFSYCPPPLSNPSTASPPLFHSPLGVLIDGSALSEDLVDGPWRIGLELL